jgi:hypothetical protein
MRDDAVGRRALTALFEKPAKDWELTDESTHAAMV